MLRYLKAGLFLFMGLYLALALVLPSNLVILQGESLTLQLPFSLGAKGDRAVIATGDKPVKTLTLEGSSPGSYSLRLSFAGIPIKNTSVKVLENKQLAPWGIAAAMEMQTRGVLVLGTGRVHNADGRYISPCSGLVKTGDLIKKVNNRPLENKEALIKAVEQAEGRPVSLTLERDQRELVLRVSPAIGMETGEPKLGLWVRDSTKGIGTITCFDKQGRFYALGHPVTDVDTGDIMPIKGGTIAPTAIAGVNKGQKGSPGELLGATEKRQPVGRVENNTPTGIYGSLFSLPEAGFMPIGLKGSVKEGQAQVLACVEGSRPAYYNIAIESTQTLNRDKTKAMVIRITDKGLINKTGGIVQGMSGAPIIQQGKIVGAVTHVFIQEPQKGYGIYIEDMLAD